MITHAHTVTVDISSLEVLAQLASRRQADAAGFQKSIGTGRYSCLLYTSDAADE